MNNSKAIRRAVRSIVFGTVFMACMALSAPAQTIAPSSVPTNLKPPAGNQPFLTAAAVGTQNYICLASGWTFIGPQATLFIKLQWFNTTIQQQVGTHFLSPNPEEPGTNRPLWQSSVDSSIVWAKQVDASTVDPAAIPWLLLERAGKQAGPSGGTMLSQTTFIQRINTTGGLKPSTACTEGAREFVPYTADYVFYRKADN